jgi:two-component system chemotaxis response regulator CheB
MKSATEENNLIVIASSTGGVSVLYKMFSMIHPLNASVIIVQHMPEFINERMAGNLEKEANMPVQLIADKDVLKPGVIYLAPSKLHCSVQENRVLRLKEGEKVNYVCPSADVTMQSLRRPAPRKLLIGIVLTGMGQDGAEGIRHIKSIGGKTISQAEETCAVYGMPAKAVETGCVDHVLSPDAIVESMNRSVALKLMNV